MHPLNFTIAFLMLLISFTFIPFIYLGIFVSSPGPVILKQTRVGKHRRLFTLYKFRSMRLNAESAGPTWSSGDQDPRVFPFGKFLRKSRLDELPQLLNIMKGNLAFVGPRPERPEFHDVLSKAIKGFSLRLTVLPGITGWAQIRVGYTASVDEARKKLSHDLYYIYKKSTLFDFKIVLLTVGVAVKGIIGGFGDFMKSAFKSQLIPTQAQETSEQ